jgi:hypothetical protein
VDAAAAAGSGRGRRRRAAKAAAAEKHKDILHRTYICYSRVSQISAIAICELRICDFFFFFGDNDSQVRKSANPQLRANSQI